MSAPYGVPVDTSQLSREELSRLAIELYINSDQGRTTRAVELLRHARRISRCLFTVAILQTIVVAIELSATVPPQFQSIANLSIASAVGMAVLYWGLAVWATHSPLPASLAGFSIYVTMCQVTFAYAAAVLTQEFGRDEALRILQPDFGTLVKLGIMIALFRAMIAGTKYRKLGQDLSAIDPAADVALPLNETSKRRFSGVASSVVLHMSMLYFVCNITVLWGDGDLTPAVYKQNVAAMAVLVIVWSVACWRDVYRPIIKAIDPMWYFGAVALGGITYFMASGWVELLRVWADLPTINPVAEASVDNWGMEILLGAVSPAIVEELAFRGIIFGALSRILKGWETVIVTALMFMVLHANVPAFPHLLVGGVLFGMLRLKSASWLPGVFMHFIHNLLCITMPD